MTLLWPWLLLLVAVYCLVQMVRDYRARNYLMLLAGGVCVALILLAPIRSRVVKLDLPAAASRND